MIGAYPPGRGLSALNGVKITGSELAGVTTVVGMLNLSGAFVEGLPPGQALWDIVVTNKDELEIALVSGNTGKRIFVKKGAYKADTPETVLTIPSGAHVHFDRCTFDDYLLATQEQHCTGSSHITGGRVVYNTSFTTANPTRLVLDTGVSSAARTVLPPMLVPSEWYVGWAGHLYQVQARNSDTQLTLATGPLRKDLPSSVNRVFGLYRTPPSGITLTGRLDMVFTANGDATTPSVNLAGYGFDTTGLDLRITASRGFRRFTPCVFIHATASRFGRISVRGHAQYTGAWTSNHRVVSVGHSTFCEFDSITVSDVDWAFTLTSGQTATPQLIEFLCCEGVVANVRASHASCTQTGGTAANLLLFNYSSTLYSTFSGFVGQSSAGTTLTKTGASVTATGTDITMVRSD